ncbi:hypothetical protein M8C21_002923 [Ambrosia artemisiifolia]|uniref:Uncharacterized protein n=1 Tax=Ambrosia artemisiifolia TaxID=4212 RepID=A0AAD5CUL7_AMBAR|nr:hypothetical protein M8C21_002923 [Ambrosia artemisiifolia]
MRIYYITGKSKGGRGAWLGQAQERDKGEQPRSRIPAVPSTPAMAASK